MIATINNGLMRAMTAVAGLRARLHEERGQDMLEYALIGGIVAVGLGVVGGILLVAGGPFENMANAIGECINFDSVCP